MPFAVCYPGCQRSSRSPATRSLRASSACRRFFLASSRLAFAASPLNSVISYEKKTSGTQGSRLPYDHVTSNLISLLFLTYINDLPDGLTSAVKLFADDTLLYGVVVEDSDCDNLQDDLNKLEIWQHEWQMQFNPSKCNIICISNKQRPPQRSYFSVGPNLNK